MKNYFKNKKVFFVGIGGVSMSALARLVQNLGACVSGSDIVPTEIKGVKTFCLHDEKNVVGADVAVYSCAIKENNVELAAARRHGIKTVSRGEFLGQIARLYKNVISISGMHGKTTTTEMLAEIFILAGKNPTVHLGGESVMMGGNLLLGGREFFITEACEFCDSFLGLNSEVGAILNIEQEHMDYFKTKRNVEKSFSTFAQNCKNIVIANSNIEKQNNKQKCPMLLRKQRGDNNLKATLAHADENIITIGKGGYVAKNISCNKENLLVFDCYYKTRCLGKIFLRAFGIHNVKNALFAIAISRKYGIDFAIIQKALSNFKGVKRRMEIKSPSPLVICDYAHHPSEIRASIAAAKLQILKRTHKKLLVVFQPHTFSRTQAFFDDFVGVLKMSDEIFLFKTFPARENESQGKNAKDLYREIKKTQKSCRYFEDVAKLKKAVKNLNKSHVTLVLGAGDLYDYF